MAGIDKNLIKRVIDKTTSNDFLTISVPSTQKDAVDFVKKNIEKFLKKSEEYLVVVVKL